MDMFSVGFMSTFIPTLEQNTALATSLRMGSHQCETGAIVKARPCDFQHSLRDNNGVSWQRTCIVIKYKDTNGTTTRWSDGDVKKKATKPPKAIETCK